MVANSGFYTGSRAAPPTITPPIAPPSNPVTVTAPYTLAKGRTLYFQGLAITQAGSATITNAGLIKVIPNTANGATGLGEAAENPTLHDFINAKSGVLSVEAKGAGAGAYGYAAGENPVRIENDGVIQVVSLAGSAFGVTDHGGYFGATFNNTQSGLLAVWAAQTGVGLSYAQTGVALTNAGQISVIAGRAIGVIDAWSFSNSGAIIATDIAKDGGSIGVENDYTSLYHGDAETFTNSGLVEADKAFFFQASLSPPFSQTITINNSGRIYGEIDLSENSGADTIANTGTIIGVINCSGSSNAQLMNSGLVTLRAGISQLTSVDNSGAIEGVGTLNIEGAGAAFINEAAGLLESKGNLTVATPIGQITNNGVIEAASGVLDIKSAVTGSGSGEIAKGVLRFDSTFSENVSFAGTSGVLVLAKSHSYTGVISGFSNAGGTKLDLRDVGFVSPTEATFSGTDTGGTLTVGQGSHPAKIALFGAYMASTFVASSDGHGGTMVYASAASVSPSVLAAAGH